MSPKYLNKEERKTVNYWTFVMTSLPVAIMIFTIYKKDQLRDEYRWTLAKPIEIDTQYVLNIPPSKKFLIYSYMVNNKSYEGELELTEEQEHADLLEGNYLIHFSPVNPSNSTIPKLEKAAGYLDRSHMPPHGIHADSLNYFLRKLRIRLKNAKTPKD